MVVWQSAEGEPTDIQRLDIWSPPSRPLSATFSCPGFCVCVRFVCVYVSEGIYTHKKNIYFFKYLFDNSVEQKKRTGKETQGVRGWKGGWGERLVDAY